MIVPFCNIHIFFYFLYSEPTPLQRWQASTGYQCLRLIIILFSILVKYLVFGNFTTSIMETCSNSWDRSAHIHEKLKYWNKNGKFTNRKITIFTLAIKPWMYFCLSFNFKKQRVKMWCRSFCINDIFSFKYNMIHVVDVIAKYDNKISIIGRKVNKRTKLKKKKKWDVLKCIIMYHKQATWYFYNVEIMETKQNANLYGV